ncbi:MAG: hypothetical protein Kow0090_03260 [Myxococcota bacterium]
MKVICPQCGKDYNIDESRIPPSGINIKCPKCMHAFRVDKPSEQKPSPQSPPQPSFDEPPPPPPSIPDVPDLPGIPPVPEIPNIPDLPDIPSGAPSTLPGVEKSYAPAPVPKEPDINALFDDVPLSKPSAEEQRQVTRVASPSYDPSSLEGFDAELPDVGNIDIPKDFEFVDTDFGVSLGAKTQPDTPAPQSSSLPGTADSSLPGLKTVHKYFVKRPNGKIYGPFDINGIKQMLLNNELSADEEYSLKKEEGWEPLALNPQLTEIIQKKATESEKAKKTISEPRLVERQRPRAKREQDDKEIKIPIKTVIIGGTILVAAILVVLFVFVLGGEEELQPDIKKIVDDINIGNYKGLNEAFQKSKADLAQHPNNMTERALFVNAGMFIVRYYNDTSLAKEIENDANMLEKEDEKSFYALLARANYKIYKQDSVLALSFLNKALEKDPQNSIALLLKGDATSINNPKAAVEDYKKAAGSRPEGFAPAYHRLGVLYAKQKEQEKARDMFSKALVADSNHLISVVELISLEDLSKREGREEVLKHADVISQKGKGLLPTNILILTRSKISEVYIVEGNYEKASEELKEVVAIQPDDINYRKKYGDVLFKLKKFSMAARQYEAALTRNPDDADSIIGLATSWIEERNILQALQKLKDVQQKLDKDARIWYYIGVCNKELERYTDAEEALKTAIARDPNYLDPYLTLAKVLTTQGRDKEAQAVLGQAREISKESPEVAYGLAEIDLNAKETNKAIEAMAATLKSHPTYYKGYYLLGRAYLEGGYLEQAIESLNRAYEKQPNIEGLALAMGRTLYEMGDYKRAIEFLNRGVKELPDNSFALTQLSKAYFKDKQIDKAQEGFETAIMLDRRNAEAYFYKGMCLREKKDFETAITAMRNATTEDKENGFYYLELGRTNLMAVRFTEAITELEKATKFIPNDKDVYALLGEAQMKMQNFKEAREALTQAIKNGADPAPMWMRIGDIYLMENNTKNAIKAYLAAVKADKTVKGGYVNLARAYLLIDKNKDAKDALMLSLKYDPQSYDAYKLLGFEYKAAGKTNQAKEMFETYLKKAPDASDRTEIEDELRYLK